MFFNKAISVSKKNEMGWAWSMYTADLKYMQQFIWQSWGEDPFEILRRMLNDKNVIQRNESDCWLRTETSGRLLRTEQWMLRQWPTSCALALFYNTSTTILYVFRALHAHRQEVETVLMQHLVSSSQSVVVRCTGWGSSLSTCAPDDHWLRGRYQMLHQNSFNLLTMSM